MADEIFKIWDKKLRRYITFAEFSKNLIALGLAPDQNIVRKIMIALKGENSNFPDQLNAKEFRHLFETSRFGNKASEKIAKEFKDATSEFAHQQFVRIIGSQLMADLEDSPKNKKQKRRRNSSNKGIETQLNALEANHNKLEMMKSIKNLGTQEPTMSQKLDILEGWYVAKTGSNLQVATIREIAEIILAKGLTTDIDSAIKIVFAQLKIPQERGDSY